MKHPPGLAYWLRVVGLPLLLVLLTSLLLGAHYETNDDFSITLLLRGRTAAAPVTDLHLYFHGWAWLLARLYQLAPTVPWYGLTLYALLALALVLLTAMLERLLAPHTRPWPRAGLLAAFLLLAGLEHAQWFNYVRVPLLLSGAAVLWAAQLHGRRWVLLLALLLFGAAWGIRPSAALLGAAAVAPAAWWLGGRPAGRVVLSVAAVALLLGGLLQLTRPPEAARYRRLDVRKSEVLDYGWRVPAPRTRADSLGVQAVEHWAFGDTTLVNEAFFQRAYRPQPQPAAFLAHKAGLTVLAVVRDYFPLLIINGLLLWLGLRLPAAPRRRQWLYLLAFGGLLLALGAVLKLPPRLAGPLLTLLTVAHLGLLPRRPWPWPRGLRRYVASGLLGGLLLLYGAKVVHRAAVLQREESRNGEALLRLAAAASGQGSGAPAAAPGPLVGSRVEGLFKSLSPFRQYLPAGGPPWLLLTGWPTLDPSQPRLRQQLSGVRVQAEALRRLRRRPAVRWVGEDSVTEPRLPEAAQQE